MLLYSSCWASPALAAWSCSLFLVRFVLSPRLSTPGRRNRLLPVMGRFGWWKGFALVALNTPFAAAADNAACTCTGLDYTDGGSYLVDGSSNDGFSFTSVFRCKLPLRETKQMKHGHKLIYHPTYQHAASLTLSSPSCSTPKALAISARRSTWALKASSNTRHGMSCFWNSESQQQQH